MAAAVALVMLPITAELAENAPAASDNCAENVLPAANVPLIENETVTAPPGQMVDGVTEPVVIVWAKL